jgi:aspartate-semialdehyde dehydrogenase
VSFEGVVAGRESMETLALAEDSEIRAYNVAIVGATGLVGQELMRCLQQRVFPLGRLRLLASARSAGAKIPFGGEELTVEETSLDVLKRSELAFFAAAPEVSAHLASTAIKNGTVVIDIANAFPADDRVPIIVPEINLADLKRQAKIIVSPTAVAIELSVVLAPIHKINPIKRILVSTYESVSGSGAVAVEELSTQARLVMEGRPVIPHYYPHQIAFNLLPETDVVLDNGYTREEWRIAREVRRLLHSPSLAIAVTTVRVPVYYGHAASVHIELTRRMAPDAVRALLAGAPGVRVLDDPGVSLYPQPWVAAGQDDVFVGRIREDETHDHGLLMWIVVDNIRKGGALNAVQIAEALVERGWLTG